MLLAHLVSGRYGDPGVDPGPRTDAAKAQHTLLRWIAALFAKKS